MTSVPEEETPFPVDEGIVDDEGDETPADKLLDRFRVPGVGVEDPNIVGDAGPTDVAPGADPPS